MKSKAVLIFLGIVGFSCGQNKPVNRQAVLEEMKNRELRRLTEEQIITQGNNLGNYFLRHKSHDSLRMEFIKKYVHEIDTLSLADSSSNERLKPVVEAFAYAWQNGIAPDPGIQASDEKFLYFTAPCKTDSLLAIQLITLVKKSVVLSID